MRSSTGTICSLLLLVLPSAAGAQVTDFPEISHIVVPQSRGFSTRSATPEVAIEEVLATVRIVDQTATTTLEARLRNPGTRDAEAVLLLPVPDGAAIHSFSFLGTAAESRAEVLPADVARRTYEDIVRTLRDPALLEFAGFRLVRSSVFPVPAGGEQRVRLTYEHLLPADGARIDYVLPRSESLRQNTPWSIEVEIASTQSLDTVYSPSHELLVDRKDARHLGVRTAQASARTPGPFRLSILRECGEVGASLFAYPDPGIGGGYFLLMASVPSSPQRRSMPREVILVLDRSGSMAGVKLDQAKAAAMQVIEGLEEDEFFQIVDYANDVARFRAEPVAADRVHRLEARDYLAGIRPSGGTNLYDAISEALRTPQHEGRLPLILFLTDGLPTVGRTQESELVRLVDRGNLRGQRIFTFGVGADVNAPLLDRISDTTRAVTTFVAPDEDIELAVAGMFRRLSGPMLADACLEVLTPDGDLDTTRVREQIPALLPDVFDGDTLIVLGQYRGEEPLNFRLRGTLEGRARDLRYAFSLKKASVRNAFVPRLWATRRINFLVDQIRRLGATEPSLAASTIPVTAFDPRLKELSDEILRLSTEFGILSEFTSFLAREGTANPGDWTTLAQHCASNLEEQALHTRSGVVALQNGRNFNERKLQAATNPRQVMWNENLEKVEYSQVQQVCDRGFFHDGRGWVDGRILQEDRELQVDEVVEFGGARHFEILAELVTTGRQGLLALDGEILLKWHGSNVKVLPASSTEYRP